MTNITRRFADIVHKAVQTLVQTSKRSKKTFRFASRNPNVTDTEAFQQLLHSCIVIAAGVAILP